MGLLLKAGSLKFRLVSHGTFRPFQITTYIKPNLIPNPNNNFDFQINPLNVYFKKTVTHVLLYNVANVPPFVHLVLNHSSSYTVFCLHGCFSKVLENSVSRGPPPLYLFSLQLGILVVIDLIII